MAPHAEEPASPQAEAVFATFVEEVERGAEPDIEEYCARHAALAPELRRLHEGWRRIDALLARLATEAAATETDEGTQRRTQETIRSLQRRMPLGARYRVLGAVARGGMSTVLSVRDEDLRRRLAMKVLLERERDGDPEHARIGHFVEEARITGQLEHPGIVPVHDLGLDERGNLYFTMRLVEGRDLGQVFELSRGGDPSWTRARVLSVLLKVCEAMAFAHSRGVVHRDLKPANVMVGTFGETYVMDWGLALVQPTAGERPAVEHDPELARRSDLVVGTPGYMAPEQADADVGRTGPRSDVYALGAMLYQFLTGAVPYVEGDERVGRGELLGRLRRGPPATLSELAPDVAPELAAICEKAMAREPEERYASMRELADDLLAFLDRRVVQAFETGAWAELKKWVARNRTAAAAIALALIALVASLAGRSVTLARGRAELLLLSDTRLLSRLVEQAEGLWPPDPARIPEMDAWLRDARDLVTRRAAHLGAMAGLAPSALEPREPPFRPLTELEREELEVLRAVVAHGPHVTARAEAVADPALRAKLLDKFATELPLAQARLAELEARAKEEAEAPRLGDQEQAWQYESHARLVGAIDALTDPDPHRGWIASVERARELAVRLEDAMGAHRAEWSDAIAAIADPARSPRYGGLEIEPQLGLVPLGPDPDSGLWEFAHLQSGEVALRGEDGRLVVGPRSAIVLVLLPGGTFAMGAEDGGPEARGENFDPDARYGEQPVHEVELTPFFVSKYETTQAQWLRAAGEGPSYFGAGFVLDTVQPPAEAGWTHPVEQVDWFAATRVLGRMGLALPTEAQWEYAARAGTRTPYWSGADLASLVGGANLQDSAEAGGWTDGHAMPAAVDALRPNGFGLHHVAGNVAEWCRDAFNTSYLWPARPGDGLRQAPYDGLRVVRGGGFGSAPTSARAAFRNDFHPDHEGRDLGCRAVRPLRGSASD